jgi:hypothetical protein
MFLNITIVSETTTTWRTSSRLEVPGARWTTGKNRWKTILDSTEIESKLLERNLLYFGQAQDTPLTVPPLADLLGVNGTSDSVDEILKRIHNLDQYALLRETKAILEERLALQEPIQTNGP